MNMLYHIRGICPRTDISTSRCNFAIDLYPGWKAAVASEGITSRMAQVAINNCHRAWLDGCGFGEIYDPEDPLDKWKADRLLAGRKLSASARPLYREHDIRVSWGEWGPEHIQVPGNACGLDLDDHSIGAPPDGVTLQPHNIDHQGQVMLILTVFLFFADCLVAPLAREEYNRKLKGRA